MVMKEKTNSIRGTAKTHLHLVLLCLNFLKIKNYLDNLSQRMPPTHYWYNTSNLGIAFSLDCGKYSNLHSLGLPLDISRLSFIQNRKIYAPCITCYKQQIYPEHIFKYLSCGVMFDPKNTYQCLQ